MRNFRTITVAKLIELLEGENPDTKVIFACDYGDYHHTTQALNIKGETEEVTIEKSAYSHSGFAVASEEPEDDDYETYLLLK